MLGHQVYHHFKAKGHNIVATDLNAHENWLSYQDVRDYWELSRHVKDFKPDVIMNLAAITDLEHCEINPDVAVATNAIGSAHCATLAANLNAVYLYISTAGIFDGSQDTFSDWDIPNPLGVYAKSKYMGEQFAQIVPKHIVLRCGWQMGSCEHDKKFIGKIMKQLKAGATELNVVYDKLGSPTYTVDFTKQIETMIDANAYGVWNAVCDGDASRYEVAEELLKLLGLFDSIKINIVSSNFFKKEYFAPRPASEKLTTEKLTSAGLKVMRHWKVCLKEYVQSNPEFFTIRKK